MLSAAAFAQDVAEVSSPDNNISCRVKYVHGVLSAVVRLDAVNSETVKMDLGVQCSCGLLGTVKDVFVETVFSRYDGIIASKISERSLIIDRYNEVTMRFVSHQGIGFDVMMRVYNEGVAVKYIIKSDSVVVKDIGDKTSIDLSGFGAICYAESRMESAYIVMDSSSTGNSVAPLFVRSPRLCVLLNEAGNFAVADPLKIVFSKSKYSFRQFYDNGRTVETSWRYCIFADSPAKMIDGKYIITSLNPKNEDNTDWIKPGKTFRVCIPDGRMLTDSVKNRIDFARRMNCGYVLLDAGWYGQGLGGEHNRHSDPRVPIPGLDIKEVCRYAAENGVGVILYVNRMAWTIYDNKAMLDTYQKWGVSGLKLGFMTGTTQEGLRRIYSIVKGAYDRQMIVNVHDEMRQSGLERLFPNLITSEGVRGNEHLDNQGDHTTLLPFTRFMTGSGDYTICYRGYSDNNYMYKTMATTKGHQLAIATAFFCPIQHVLWYGRPYDYTNETEIEYFRELPTVWDDYKVLDGSPEEYFSIARRSGGRWFLSTHTYSARTAELNLNFLEKRKKYYAVIYEDADSATIRKTIRYDLTPECVLNLTLVKNGGAVAIISVIDKKSGVKPTRRKSRKGGGQSL